MEKTKQDEEIIPPVHPSPPLAAETEEDVPEPMGICLLMGPSTASFQQPASNNKGVMPAVPPPSPLTLEPEETIPAPFGISLNMDTATVSLQQDPNTDDEGLASSEDDEGDPLKRLQLIQIFKNQEKTLVLLIILHTLNLILHLNNLIELYFDIEAHESVIDTNLVIMNFGTLLEMLNVVYSSSVLADIYQVRNRVTFRAPWRGPIPVRKMISLAKSDPSRILPCEINFALTVTMLIFYWPTYLYDSDLIIPKSLRNMYFDSFNCVHIMHTWPGVFIFFEIIFYPRPRPSFIMGFNCTITMLLAGFYMLSIISAVPVYPVLASDPSLIHVLVTFSVVAVTGLAYMLQWCLFGF